MFLGFSNVAARDSKVVSMIDGSDEINRRPSQKKFVSMCPVLGPSHHWTGLVGYAREADSANREVLPYAAAGR